MPITDAPHFEFFMWLDKDGKPVTGTRHRSLMTAVRWKTTTLPKVAPAGAHVQQRAAVTLKKGKIVFEDLTADEQRDLDAVMRLHGRP